MYLRFIIVIIIISKKFYITNSIEQNLSWEADSRSAGSEIPCILWNPKFHCCVHKSPPLDPILNQINQFTSSHTLSLRSTFFLNLNLRLPSGLRSDFMTKILYIFLFSTMHGTLHLQPIVLDLIILVIFGEEHKLSISSWHNFIQLPNKKDHMSLRKVWVSKEMKLVCQLLCIPPIPYFIQFHQMLFESMSSQMNVTL
jgi:hypothetical protein